MVEPWSSLPLEFFKMVEYEMKFANLQICILFSYHMHPDSVESRLLHRDNLLPKRFFVRRTRQRLRPVSLVQKEKNATEGGRDLFLFALLFAVCVSYPLAPIEY